MSQQAVAEAIHQQLTADQSAGSLWSALGGRVYHLQAPPNTALPMLTVRIDDDQPQAFYDGSSDLRVEVEITIQAADAATLLAASDLAFARLQRQALTIDGLRRASMRAVDRGKANADRDALTTTSRWILTATTR